MSLFFLHSLLFSEVALGFLVISIIVNITEVFLFNFFLLYFLSSLTFL